MYIFIDESGDTGCKNSATQYFIIALVIFNSLEDLQDTQIAIEEFKKNESIYTELHFCKMSLVMRDKLFYYIKDLKFNAKVICVNKQELYSDFLIHNPQGLYNYMLKMLLDSIKETSKIKIIMDGKGNKTLERQLKQYLRQNLKLNIEKITSKDSKSDVLLQLADSIASSVGHSFNKKDKPNSDKWKNIISKKTDIWSFR